MRPFLTQGFVFAGFLALLLLFPEIFVFVSPGLLLVSNRRATLFPRDDVLSVIGNTVVLSFAFWVLSYWLTMLFPLTLTEFFYLSNVVFSFCLTRTLYRSRVTIIRGDRETAVLLAVFSLIGAARFVLFVDRITGSVGDMTQHLYMARLVMIHNGYSPSYLPLFPFRHFGEYPLGYHTLAADLVRVGAAPLHRVALFLSCAIYVLLHLGLYQLLARHFSKILSLVVSGLVLFLSHYPQFLNQWGSTPTALSTCFLFFAYDYLSAHSTSASQSFAEYTAIALVLAAGFLSHLIPPIGFLLYFGVHALTQCARGEWDARVSLTKNAPALVLAGLFVIPLLVNFDVSVFARSTPAISHGHADSLSRIFDFPRLGSLPAVTYVVGFVATFVFLFGPTLVVVLVFAALRCLFRLKLRCPPSKLFLAELASAVGAFWCVLGLFRFQVTPFHHLLQTERIHYFLLIPAALVVAAGWTTTFPTIHPRFILGLSLGVAALVAWNVVDHGARQFESHYSTFAKDRRYDLFLLRDAGMGSLLAYALDKANASVTESDLKAFEWIKRFVETDAIFLTNYGDGGGLIASLGERRVSNPHGMEIWHGDELREWQSKNRATHVYVGRQSNPRYPMEFNREELRKQPEKYRLLYDREGCSVFRIESGNDRRDPDSPPGRRG